MEGSGALRFSNRTGRIVWLLEGVEGVYKPLAMMLHDLGDYILVRSIIGGKTECHYLVIVDEPDVWARFNSTLKTPGAVVVGTTVDPYILHLHPSTMPSGNTQSKVILKNIPIDDPPTFKLTCFFESADPVWWYDRLQVPGFNIREYIQCVSGSGTRTIFPTDEIEPVRSCIIEALHRQEIKSLLQIKPSENHTDGSAALELWESKEKVFRLEIENVQANLKEYGNIIFQLVIGFYTVVHGLLFTVVSQPDSPFTCGKIRISYVVSFIISSITILGVIKNVKAMEDLKKLIYEHEARLLAVCRWQSTLKREGDRFDYGSATLVCKPMSNMEVWWLPSFLPLKAVFYTFLIFMCSFLICYLMYLLQCGE